MKQNIPVKKIVIEGASVFELKDGGTYLVRSPNPAGDSYVLLTERNKLLTHGINIHFIVINELTPWGAKYV